MTPSPSLHAILHPTHRFWDTEKEKIAATFPPLFLGGSLVSHHPLPHFPTDPVNVKLRGSSDCSLSDPPSLPERPRTALLPTRCHCPHCSSCRRTLPCTLSSTLTHPPVGPLPCESFSCAHAYYAFYLPHFLGIVTLLYSALRSLAPC